MALTAAALSAPALPRSTLADRWILSRLNSVLQLADASYADYEPTIAARAIQDFVVEDLSNWYVRLNRRRFWKGELGADKNAAFRTLHRCLEVGEIAHITDQAHQLQARVAQPELLLNGIEAGLAHLVQHQACRAIARVFHHR